MSLDRERLRKVLAMLASNHDGERLAALAAVQRTLQAAGMRFEDLATGQAPGAPSADDVAALRRQVHSAALTAMAQQHKINELTLQLRQTQAEREQHRARAMLAEEQVKKARDALGVPEQQQPQQGPRGYDQQRDAWTNPLTQEMVNEILRRRSFY